MQNINGNYFETQNVKLYYLVVGTLDGCSECLLYLSPFFEERLWVQRVAFIFAKEYNKITGNPVVMMDYYGYGESDGDTEDFSLEGAKEHILMLMNYLQINFNIARFALWGARGGCLLATMLEKSISQFSSMLLWAPVLDLKEFIYKQLRSTVASQGTIFKKVKATRNEILDELIAHGKCDRDGYLLNHVEGYRIGKRFWMEISANETLNVNDLRNSKIPFLVIDIISEKDAEKMNDFSTNKSKEIVRFEKVIENKFWLENLDYSQSSKKAFELSIAWLRAEK
jgi:hypothetical protein